LLNGAVSVPLKDTRAAVFTFNTLLVTETLTVQLAPGARLFKPQARRVEFPNADDCEQKPPDEAVADWTAKAAGKCEIRITPVAVCVP
jgi:hypothetical protein